MSRRRLIFIYCWIYLACGLKQDRSLVLRFQVGGKKPWFLQHFALWWQKKVGAKGAGAAGERWWAVQSRAGVVPAGPHSSEVLHSHKEGKLCTQDQCGSRDQQPECRVNTSYSCVCYQWARLEGVGAVQLSWLLGVSTKGEGEGSPWAVAL